MRTAIICVRGIWRSGSLDARRPGTTLPAPDPVFLERAWAKVAAAARAAHITVLLGTERVTDRGLQITACVFNADGTIAGWQDKEQIDPSEEPDYPAFGTERRVFTAGPLTFGVVICREGWRYPETVRWAVRRGAQIVFHPHAHVSEPGGYRPVTFADPANTFHEKAILCRAAENSCYFASVNCASEGSGTTSASARPDGTLLGHQPWGRRGCWWRIWTSVSPPDCLPRGAGRPVLQHIRCIRAAWRRGSSESRMRLHDRCANCAPSVLQREASETPRRRRARATLSP